MPVRSAELTTKRRNALGDSDFAIPRLRKLPLDTAARVRVALGRIGQTKGATDEEMATAKTKIKAAAKKYDIEVSDDFSEFAVYAAPLLVACAELPVDDTSAFGEGRPLPFLRVGEYDFPDYGLVTVTEDDLDRIVQNFERNARRQDLPLLNEEHIPATYADDGDVLMGPGAIGWIKELHRDGDTVYMTPDWNAAGERLLADDRYRGVSPELMLDWTDPETGDRWGMTATGGAMTTRPRMKNLAHQGGPIAAAEPRVLAFAEPVRFAYAADTHVDKALPNFSVAYAYPSKKRLPLHTAEAVKGARARFMTVDASEGERDEAWTRLAEAARQYGVDVPTSWRELKAAESARLLMQEPGDDIDDDMAAGMQTPCCFQPPYSDYARCPGFTRSDPDNDGDSDCCAMAAVGCNGYIPLQSRGGGYVNPTSYYREPTGAGGPMNDETKKGAAGTGTGAGGQNPTPASTAADNQGKAPVKAGEPPTPAGTPPAPAAAPPPAPVPTPTTPAADPAAADQPQSAADFAEVNKILAAERTARLEAQAVAQRALAAAEAAQTQVANIQAAAKLAETTRRLEDLVKKGQITPAERDTYAANIQRFAEDDWLLVALEQRPENTSVDMSERGNGTAEAPSGNASEIARKGALAIMTERGQDTNTRSKGFLQNYRIALSEFSAREARRNGLGYRG